MKSLRLWLHGLCAAAIGGAATAVATMLAQEHAPDFKVVGKVAVVGALITTAGYLTKSPLPPTGGD